MKTIHTSTILLYLLVAITPVLSQRRREGTDLGISRKQRTAKRRAKASKEHAPEEDPCAYHSRFFCRGINGCFWMASESACMKCSDIESRVYCFGAKACSWNDDTHACY